MDKSTCKGCNRFFKKSTLEKNNGNCARCGKRDIQITIQSSFPKNILKDSQAKKNPIPPKLRQEVWETNIGDKLWGNCFVCLMRISAFEYSCGHIISESKGGSMELSNMKVVCKSCNSKMGTQNMLEFKKNRYSTADAPVPVSVPAPAPVSVPVPVSVSTSTSAYGIERTRYTLPALLF